MSAEPIQTPAAQGFAALLRAHTQTIHREAERSGFVADLLRGRADAGVLCSLSRQSPLRLRGHGATPPNRPGPARSRLLRHRAWRRAPSLRHDLAAVDRNGQSWPAPMKRSCYPRAKLTRGPSQRPMIVCSWLMPMRAISAI